MSKITPAVNMVLTMASNMIKRGDEVPPNMTALLVMELERIRNESDQSQRIADMNISAEKAAKALKDSN